MILDRLFRRRVPEIRNRSLLHAIGNLPGSPDQRTQRRPLSHEIVNPMDALQLR